MICSCPKLYFLSLTFDDNGSYGRERGREKSYNENWKGEKKALVQFCYLFKMFGTFLIKTFGN